jgi:hypothetical protein
VLAVIGFLNSRERATIIWGFLLMVYVWRKDDSIGSSFLQVFRSMLHPKLLTLWITTTAFTAGLVLTANAAGLWHTTAIKETVYWFFGSGAPLTGRAIAAKTFDRAYAKRLARSAVRFTLIIEFLVGLYVMPLAAELVLVPLVALFLMMQVVAENDPAHAAIKKLLDRVLMLIGIGGMTWVLVSALTDIDGLLTREHAERLLLAPAFTLAFLPFLYAIWRWSRWEQDRTMRRWRETKVAA